MIVPLLQRCTKEFQDAKQYRNDVRYLRVWIRYIDTVQACRRPAPRPVAGRLAQRAGRPRPQDPADVFAFLEARGIGEGLSLLYTSWALVLELKKGTFCAVAWPALGAGCAGQPRSEAAAPDGARRRAGMYAEAYKKLEEGIAKKAHPQEKLQKTLEQFQHRMNQRTMQAMQQAANPEAAPAPGGGGREFGDQISKTRKLRRPAQNAVAGTTRRAAAPAAQVPAGNNNAPAGGGFTIFEDLGGDSGAPSGGFAMDALPGERERAKENARAPPPPPFPRTNRTSLVPPPVLTGQVSSLPPY